MQPVDMAEGGHSSQAEGIGLAEALLNPRSSAAALGKVALIPVAVMIFPSSKIFTAYREMSIVCYYFSWLYNFK